MSDVTALPDLASRALGGSVVHANDELFAQRENLINPEPPVFSPDAFGHKGKVYDGWETRRRREPGHDYAVARLGVPGVIRGVVVDTSWFTGNYPPFASLDAASIEGYPSPAELERAEWHEVLPRTPLQGDTANAFRVGDGRRFTHVRLNIYPDGGVARLRVHGEPVPDPRFLPAVLDLAAVENGGTVVDCSDMFYSSPSNVLRPGRTRTMGEGWENARRRDHGNDHLTVRLGLPGLVELVEIDTSYFVGNAPGSASLRGLRAGVDDVTPWPAGSVDLVPRTPLQPDTRHLFRVRSDVEVAHVRLDVFPDGGVARLRVHGRLAERGRRAAVARWLDLLPEETALRLLQEEAGLEAGSAALLLAQRPVTGEGLPDDVVRAFSMPAPA